jgi:hypothetical protein
MARVPASHLLRIAAAFAFGLWAACASAQAAYDDIVAKVRQDGSRVIVDVSLRIAATALETWDVATDYDHMAAYVSNLQVSRIIERDGNVLTITQKGKATRGPFSFTFENVRRIVLTPYREIRSQLVSGDLQSSEFTTEIVDHGDWSEIVNHGEFVPKVWVPPVFGPAIIAAETRKQFGELRDEVIRRKLVAARIAP